MKKILLAAFIILVLVQWFVPGKMIWDKNTVLTKGKAFRFETEPVDPVDPFRGRYLILDYKEDTFSVTGEFQTSFDKELFVTFTENAAGFARIKSVSLSRPVNEQYYVAANISTYQTDTLTKLFINYPFEKFFLEESKAPHAEKVFREAMADSTKKTYAVVRILKGDAVLENVFVNDKALVD